MTHKESEANKAELRALQQQQDELRITVEKQQVEKKVQSGQVRKDRQAEEPLKAREEDRSLVPTWKLLCARTPRSISPMMKRVRKDRF